MLVVRGRLDNRQALVPIGVQRFAIELSGGVAPPPTMPIVSYRALLDTGAQRTCLTHRTIANEQLRRHGKRFIKNVHDENVHSLFMVRFGFWCTDDSRLGGQDSGNSYFGLEDPVEVINIADNDRFDAIVGMDILSRFDLNFARDGEFCISLQPSCLRTQ
jgi:hypothetical protein